MKRVFLLLDFVVRLQKPHFKNYVLIKNFIVMTIESIKNIESANEGVVYAFKHGNFCRVYEKSAKLFSQNIKNYVIKKSFYKNINTEIVELGFPTTVVRNSLAKNEDLEITENQHCFEIKSKSGFKTGLEDFENWKTTMGEQPDNFDSAFVNQVTINPKPYSDGPRQVFLLCKEYNKHMLSIVDSMKKTYRYVHGNKIIENSYEMYSCATNMQENTTDEEYKELCKRIVELGNDNLKRLRLLYSAKFVDLTAYEKMSSYFFVMKDVMEKNIKLV